ncbi:MAG: galactosamine-6-phosphate isomerase, partial [Pricia sp.]|nr:galactosamine-6-phosphate isomerase [Pricia sp.]
QQNIAIPLDISAHRYISFASNPLFPEKECERIQKELLQEGPVDICILGLGRNGHIGFNEPSEYLHPHCHVAKLSQESLQHQMADTMEIKPSYGLTLGMADILQSKKIVLLLTGSNKGKVISQFLSKQITTQLPASFLWLHPNVTCYIDATAL